jgi:hypothetical protein
MDPLKIKQKARRSLQNYNGQNVRKSDLDQQDHCICSPIPFEHTLLALVVEAANRKTHKDI